MSGGWGCCTSAFYTATGVGTQVAEGGLPWRYHPDGTVAVASPAKTTHAFTVDGAEGIYVLEHAIATDFALVRTWKGDRHRNLVFHRAARNFNPLAAMAGRITIAEVEHVFEAGELDPDEIHLPGVFVQRVVALAPAQAADKRIERHTTTGERSLTSAHSGQGIGG
jgi:3-oxoacid CoA-transferase subunit A